MTLQAKNLGVIQALHIGITPPTNTKLLWYDTNVQLHKYFNTSTNQWELLGNSGTSEWQDSVIDIQSDPSVINPSEGDRYLIGSGGKLEWANRDGQIATYVNGAWTYFIPTKGTGVKVDSDINYLYVHPVDYSTGVYSWVKQPMFLPTLRDVLVQGNLTNGRDIEVSSGDRILFSQYDFITIDSNNKLSIDTGKGISINHLASNLSFEGGILSIQDINSQLSILIGNGGIDIIDSSPYISLLDSDTSYSGEIQLGSLTQSQFYQLPDKSGEIALTIPGSQQGETLRWNDTLQEWEVSDRLIIADNGNIGIGGVLSPSYQVHIDNGDVFLATGSIGINEAPTTVHFLRISTNDALPQTVNARIDLSYQNKTGTFQGLHIMSNTPKTGSNSLAYGVNVTLQGAATSGTHEYVAGRFKAVGATKNYAIKVHAEEGLSLFGTATELYSNAVVQIKGGAYNGNYYKPLVIQGSDSQFNWTWNSEGRVAVGRDTNMFEAINLQDQKIRIDGSSFNFTEYTSNGIQVKTTYPQLSKNTQIGKTVYGMGRGSYSIMTEFVEGNAVYFNHYNTNKFSAIMGREYMAIYTNGTWNATLDIPNQNTAIRTAIFREGKVGIGDTLSPQTTLHIRETQGREAFRVDTTLTNNFIKHFTNGVNDYLLIGGRNYWTNDRVYIYNSSSNSYLGIQGVGESGIRLRSSDGTVTSTFAQVGNSLLMTRSAANYEIRYYGNNHTILKINTQSGKFFFNGGNNYTSAPANEKDFDISANGLFRRKFLSGNYANIGDRENSYGLSFQSAEKVDLGGGSLALRKSEFTFQNRIENNDINTTGFYLSNEYYDNTVQTSLADLLRVSHDGDLEILQSGANGKGLILTDKTLGTRHRIELDNLTVTVSAAL